MKNKCAPGILGTYALTNETICRPLKTHETIPLTSKVPTKCPYYSSSKKKDMYYLSID